MYRDFEHPVNIYIFRTKYVWYSHVVAVGIKYANDLNYAVLKINRIISTSLLLFDMCYVCVCVSVCVWDL